MTPMLEYLVQQLHLADANPSSPAACAFGEWLDSYMVDSVSEQSGKLPANQTQYGFPLPPRAADALWLTPEPEETEQPFDRAQVEWWQEHEWVLGLRQQEDSVMGCDHFRWFRIPVAAIALRMQASAHLAEIPPVPALLHQTVHILAQAFVPDYKTSPDVGRMYALIQLGQCQYPVIFRNPDLDPNDSPHLNTAPVAFLERRIFSNPVPGGHTDNEGFLMFEDATQALTWFTWHYTHQSPGKLVPVTLPQKGESSAPGEGTRPALPDVEKMRRYQAELEADEREPRLSEQERQERWAFLIQCVRQYQQAFPLEKVKALAEGVERLLEEVQAKRQARPPQDEESEGTAMEKNILTRRQAEIAIVEAGIVGFTEQGHSYCVWHAIDRIYEGNWLLPLAQVRDKISVSYAPNGNEVTSILSDTVACEACAEERGPHKPLMKLTFTYQPKTIHLEGWDEAEEIQELFVNHEAGLPIPTGLGYAAGRDEDDLPLYYAVHIPSRQMILSEPLPTQHLIEKFLEGLLSSESLEQAEGAVCWDRPYDALVTLHTHAKLEQIVSETMEKTRTLIGWANAENTLRHLLTQPSRYLQASLDREYYERLIETLDLIACERQGDDGNL